MRKFVAIVVCKALHFALSLLGRGSSLPGSVALRICPDVLARVTLPRFVIAVTGSNGKTSTVEMIASVLRRDGREVVYNAEGSNQIEGVTTLLLCSASLSGRVRGDVVLIESDERYARYTFRYFHPTHFVITNLYRDQMTRNAHPEWVYDALLPAVHADTELLLNADDPLVSCFGAGHERTKWFGLDRCSISTDTPRGVYRDGSFCPLCKAPMVYDHYHYNHIGAFRCTRCTHRRHDTDFSVTQLDLDGGSLVIDGSSRIPLAFCSVYNVYNILAAYAVCARVGVSRERIAEVLGGYVLKNGRMVRFTLGAHHGTLLTSKHENSVAYDTNLRYIRQCGVPCEVIVIVDAVSRKYFTSETSWLWDIDFDLLDCAHVRRVWLCGRYAADLSVRFDYAALPKERLTVCQSVREACERLGAEGTAELFVVTCFSDRDKFMSAVTVEPQGEGK